MNYLKQNRIKTAQSSGLSNEKMLYKQCLEKNVYLGQHGLVLPASVADENNDNLKIKPNEHYSISNNRLGIN